MHTPGKPFRVALIVVAMSTALPLAADTHQPPAPPARHDPLDGKVFVGDFGPAGQPADRTDTLYFSNGKFWSENCVPCGFPPGDYWIHYGEDAIHFRGKLRSPERGSFSYSGEIRDGEMEASINWRKERWYWTIDRDFHFQGELVEAPGTLSTREATRAALADGPDPSRDCHP